MKTDNLTPKQQKFCDEYLTDFNASRAALAAGYSAGTALNGQLMQLPKIRLYIQQHTQAAAQKAQVGREDVLAELCKIAFANFGNYYLPNGNLKPMDGLTNDEKAALWQAKTNPDGTTSVKMYNKLVALEKIAKILNLYTAEVKQPETEVVYIDKQATTEDDYFDDAELKASQNVFIDEKGGRLYGDGYLPYGPVSNVFKFGIDEVPDMMIYRLKHYEGMQADMLANAQHTFETVDFKSQLNRWLDMELRPHNCVIAGDTYNDILEKYTALREFKRKVDMKMAG